MIEALRLLVEAESFSSDAEGVERCAAVIDDLCREILGAGTTAAGPHRMWRREGDRPVLFLCHFDTVWPPGTVEEFPFDVDDGGVARGPGSFDMKAGIVQCLEAIRQVPNGPVTVLFTGDEEIGSPTSRPLIEEEAGQARAVLVMEPSDEGRVKVARKGTATYRVEVVGRAAHAGLAPHEGINAAVVLARLIDAIGAIADPAAGTTVTVTTIGGGTAANVVPEAAWCTVDVRMWSDEEAERVEAALAGLAADVEDAEVRVAGGLNRGPLERETSEGLYRRLVALGYDVGQAAVGGASDGNLTAALGVPTLDGLGAVGGGAHARGEHVLVDEMEPRAEMVARLTADLLDDG